MAGIVHLDEISSPAGTLPAKKSTTIKYAACTFKNTFYASAYFIMLPFETKFEAVTAFGGVNRGRKRQRNHESLSETGRTAMLSPNTVTAPGLEYNFNWAVPHSLLKNCS